MSSLAMLRVADQILAEAIRAKSRTKPAEAARPIGFAPSIRLSRKRPVSRAPAIPGMAPAATMSKPCHNSMPSKPDWRGPVSHAHTHFLGPLDDGVRNDAVNANQGQQQCDSRKNPHGGSVKPRAGEDLIEPLLHGFHTEYRNLRVYRPVSKIASRGSAAGR